MGYTDSVSATIALPLEGVWIHDPLAAEATVRHWPYGSARRGSEVDAQGSLAWYAGRSSPLADYGDGTGRSFTVGVDVPHGATWYADLAGLRAFAESKRTLVFRDNRGRVAYGQISSYREADKDWGTDATFTFTETSYDRTVVS